MLLRNWLETLGSGYRAEVTEGGDGGGGVAAPVMEDGIDTIDTTATDPTYDEYDVVDPIHEERSEEANETDEPESDELSPPEPEVDSQKAVEPPAGGPDYPSELLDQAGQLGFRYEDVQALGSPAALRVAVTHKLNLLRDAMAHVEAQKAPTPAGPSQTDQLRAHLAKLREEGFDENLIEFSESLVNQNQALAEQLQTVKKSTDDYQQDVQRQAAQLKEQLTQQAIQQESKALVNWFDKQIESAPESYQQVLGKGSTFDVAPGSPEYIARDQVMRAVNNFQSNWQKWGFKSDNDPKLFQSALQVTLGTHQKTQAREDLKSAMRANGSKVTARPTHTTSAPLDGRERAATNADRHPLFRRNG